MTTAPDRSQADLLRSARRRLLARVALLGVVLALGAHARPAAAQRCAPPVARMVSVQGTAEAQIAGTTSWSPARLNDAYCPGDTIRVGDRSRADVALLDSSVLRLSAGTTTVIEAVRDERTAVIDLLKGAAHFLSRGARSLDVRTPFTVAGVRGTEFFVAVDDARAVVTIFEGTVVAENPAGAVTLTGGQSAVAEKGQPPVVRVVARPRDAVHWALYYPPVVYFRPDELPAGPGWPEAVRASLEATGQGDLRRAFDALAAAPPGVPDARFFAHRASLLLAVGQVDAARADIQQALRLRANDPNALGLEAIVALVQGETDRALAAAQQAVQAAPESGTARVALSYAQQARFDLEAARASLEEAVRGEPQNALAWARLSELHASFGELDKALDAAQRAAALQPNLARTQTVLGYAYLMEVKTREAREAFERAIALDQADPLPRLGLGLAKIREGRLPEGRRDLEVAASLDSGNALVRSYLGKAYYEEKRSPLDEREYSVARQLDPNDPTPWFYDAIAKQTTNRPVEALHDLQRAIELNDNRAVYRSRLLLDADLAARSASLARVYTDLGFQQLALVEGWKSANIDPGNYSAHRFLADTYAALPRHEIARVSELLQSQLLQPTNITPIQPRLAESNLFLISAGGPGTLSFNEFNPLFERNRLAGLLSGLIGENDTYAGEAVISGIYGRASFSIGYSHFETDGFRLNSDQTEDLVSVFLQYEITAQTSVQAEYRYRESERGDLRLRFFPEDFFPGERTTEERHTFRLGGRHAFTPGSILLGSVIYQDAEGRQFDDQLGGDLASIDLDTPQTALGVELQHLFRSRWFNLTTGAGFFHVDGEFTSTIGLAGPEPIVTTSTASTDLEHINTYAYGYVKLVQNLVITAGLSADFLDADDPAVGDREEFNPKFGLLWEPLPGTTLRVAAFRVLKRTLITNQTLEPTQVAGFNQFFDDPNGTEAWRYGGGIDQKITRSVFAGVEFSKRDLETPFLDFVANPEAPPVRTLETEEYLGRAYLFWTPHPWVALRTEYLYERQDSESLFGTQEIKTHRVPLGIALFHPSGWSASFTATYYNQDVQLDDGRSGRDTFWLLDAALSYRLPKRLGFITVGVTNLLDEEFRYYDIDLRNASIQPVRTVFARFTVQY
jgi:tetratricopeptide (TPR) repeat protein